MQTKNANFHLGEIQRDFRLKNNSPSQKMEFTSKPSSTSYYDPIPKQTESAVSPFSHQISSSRAILKWCSRREFRQTIPVSLANILLIPVAALCHLSIILFQLFSPQGNITWKSSCSWLSFVPFWPRPAPWSIYLVQAAPFVTGVKCLEASKC